MDKTGLKNEEEVKDFNQYFGYITNSFVECEFSSEKCERLGKMENIIFKFKKHRSMMKLRKVVDLTIIWMGRG